MNKLTRKVTTFSQRYDLGDQVPYTIWASLVGKLVSYAMLHAMWGSDLIQPSLPAPPKAPPILS